MKIRVWQKDYDLVDETVLGPGDFTAVKPGLYHTFEGIEDGIAFELYWANFQHNDIHRESVGHLKQENNVVLVAGLIPVNSAILKNSSSAI